MDLFENNFQEAKKIYLKEFSIENYRSISEKVTYDLNERGIVFSGESGVGKTSRIEALLWLLTGKLFDGSTNQLSEYIMPKNKNEDTTLMVSAKFIVGMEVFIFEKRMKDTITYYVNGTPKKTVKEYNQALYRAFGLENALSLIEKETKLLSKVDLIMLFMVLDFFPTLDNKTLRELVLLVGGSVEISKMEMSELLRENLKVKFFDLDELKKEIKLHLKGDKNRIGLKSQLSTIETEIKTHQNTISGLKDISDIDVAKERLKEIKGEVAKLQIELEKGEQEISSQYDLKISKLQLELNEKTNKKQNETNEELKELEIELSNFREKYAESSKEINENKNKIEDLKRSVLFNESQIDNLKTKGKLLVEQKRTIQKQNEITCPKCEHNFVVEHEHENILKIDVQLKELKTKILEFEKGIKNYIDEEIKLNQIIEKLSFKNEEIKEGGIRLSETIKKMRESNDKDRRQSFNDESELGIIKEINILKNSKNDVLLDLSISRSKIKNSISNLEAEEEKLLNLIYSEKAIENALKEIQRLQLEQKNIQEKINSFEQLESEVKILEEDWLRKIDENISSAFGENIKFKMFETNASNENISPICEMYVKDSFGNWVNAINGINTGHGVPRLVEFLTIVRRKLEIRDGILLIDFFESIGSEPLEKLMSYNQQVIATSVVRKQFELKTENL